MVKMVAQICVYKMFLLCSGSVASDDVMLRYATLSSKLLNPEKLLLWLLVAYPKSETQEQRILVGPVTRNLELIS